MGKQWKWWKDKYFLRLFNDWRKMADPRTRNDFIEVRRADAIKALNSRRVKARG